MVFHNQKLGKFGENLASKFLQKNGCRITDKNYYTRYGEIDLIASSGDEILFIEVKTRSSSDFGYPEQAVDRQKIKKILKTIQIYLQKKQINKFWRFDVISVEVNKETRHVKIKWFKNIGLDFQ